MTYTRRILQVLLTVLLFQPLALKAFGYQENGVGHLLGVSVTGGEQALLSAQDLAKIEELGFSILETEGNAPAAVLDFIGDSGLYLFVRQPRMYVTRYQLEKNDSLYIQQDLDLIDYYRNETGGRTAFGLFTYPDDRNPAVIQLMNQHAERLQELHEDELTFYYRSAWPGPNVYPVFFSFRSARVASTRMAGYEDLSLSEVVHFDPAGVTVRSLMDLKELLQASLESGQSIIILPWSWLSRQLTSYDPLTEILKTYNLKEEFLFPEPNVPEGDLSANWIILLVVLLLGSYLIHYRFNPTYRNSLFRYFLIHRYFVENTVEYRFRTYLTGAVLFFQHLILTGIFAWVFASSSISSLGFDSLGVRFPSLAFFVSDPDGFFLFGLLAAFLLQTVSVIWIHFFNRRTRLSQTLALYCWPLHLNLLIVLVMTIVFSAGGAQAWIFLLSLLFLLVWFFSFTTAAIDLARLLRRYKALYLFFTAGLYTLIVIFLAALLLFYEPLSQSLRFALSLP